VGLTPSKNSLKKTEQATASDKGIREEEETIRGLLFTSMEAINSILQVSFVVEKERRRTT